MPTRQAFSKNNVPQDTTPNIASPQRDHDMRGTTTGFSASVLHKASSPSKLQRLAATSVHLISPPPHSLTLPFSVSEPLSLSLFVSLLCLSLPPSFPPFPFLLLLCVCPIVWFLCYILLSFRQHRAQLSTQLSALPSVHRPL